MKIMRTGILGGSFDPPTIAHALMAAELLNLRVVDRVIIVPCGNRADKQLSAGLHRLNMLQLMIENIFPTKSRVEVSDIEVRNGDMIPTYFMLKQLEQQMPDQELHFVIGSDLVEGLVSWDEGVLLKQEMKFIILNRNTSAIDKLDLNIFPSHYQMIPHFSYGISSTEVRQRMKYSKDEWMDSIGMVTKSVLQYIIDNKLYI